MKNIALFYSMFFTLWIVTIGQFTDHEEYHAHTGEGRNTEVTYRTKQFKPTASNLFPEQSRGYPINADTVGIAFSGGGSRAMSCALGELKGLANANMLDRIKYVSCISGGCWASSLFTYTPTSVANEQQLFSAYARPEDLVNGSSSQNPCEATNMNCMPPNNIGAAPQRLNLASTITTTFRATFSDTTERVWIAFIREKVLLPNQVVGPSVNEPQPFTLHAADRDAIVAANPQAASGITSQRFTLYRDSNRPFLIMGSAISPDSSDQGLDVYDIVPFEATPLTAGTAQLYPDTTGWVGDFGGGEVEPFAYGSFKYHSAVLRVKVLSVNGHDDDESDPSYVQGEFQGSQQRTQGTVPIGASGTPTTFTANNDLVWDFTTLGVNPDTVLKLRFNEDNLLDDRTIKEVKFDVRTLLNNGQTQSFSIVDGPYTFAIEASWDNNFGLFPIQNDRIETKSSAFQYGLETAVGTSSMAVSGLLLDLNILPGLSANDILQLSPELSSAPLEATTDPKNIAATFPFLDGGNIDYTGVYPLLRRKIPKLMIMVNTGGENVAMDTTATPNVIAMPESVAYMWGLQRRRAGEQWKTFANDPIPTDIQDIYAFRNNQVFNNISEFQQLSQDLLAAANAGTPVWKKQKLTVQANAFWGIESYEVIVLWCINQLNKKWEERLSTAGKAKLAQIQNDQNNLFPGYNFLNVQLNEAEVGMVANMWATSFLDDNHNGEFRSFMASTVATDVLAANAPLINFNPAPSGTGTTTPTGSGGTTVPAGSPSSGAGSPPTTVVSFGMTVQPLLWLIVLCLCWL